MTNRVTALSVVVLGITLSAISVSIGRVTRDAEIEHWQQRASAAEDQIETLRVEVQRLSDRVRVVGTCADLAEETLRMFQAQEREEHALREAAEESREERAAVAEPSDPTPAQVLQEALADRSSAPEFPPGDGSQIFLDNLEQAKSEGLGEEEAVTRALIELLGGAPE